MAVIISEILLALLIIRLSLFGSVIYSFANSLASYISLPKIEAVQVIKAIIIIININAMYIRLFIFVTADRRLAVLSANDAAKNAIKNGTTAGKPYFRNKYPAPA